MARRMRILLFHGYLLRGTGSNVYNASLAAALVHLGHEVHLLCQDRHAAEMPFVDAVGRWRDGRLEIETMRDPVRCTAYLPDIGQTLPVYVADEYEGFEARPFPELTDDEVEHYVSVNAAAVREVAERADIELGLANHMVMGPAILARGLDAPYAVKIHGSALTYTVAPHPQRFLPYAREGLTPARAVLVGSRHTAEGLWDAMDDPELRARTRLGPPGVDADAFVPRPREEAARRLRALADRLEGHEAASGWGSDTGAAAALRALEPERQRIVSFVGKLIVSKGVDLLIAAWPLISMAAPDARLCMVGFGTYREGAERLVAALREGDLGAAREVARLGRELEGGPAGELRYLAQFLDGLEGERREPYVVAARRAMERVHFTGRLEYSDLPDLLPACDVQVVPSTWPEAFGMVAAEAACCGVLPVSTAHSGLAEVSLALAEALPEDLRPLLSFELGAGAVEEIADRVTRWLALDPERRAQASQALSDLARERFSWQGVARGVIAAAEGRLDALPRP
jgi:glycosyltransferase involved in cell wall biosynthesis